MEYKCCKIYHDEETHAPCEEDQQPDRSAESFLPAEKRTQLRLTVDSRFTKIHFNQLFAVLKIRRKNALAEHIIMSFKTKAAQAQLLAFYNGPWLNIPFQSYRHRVRLPFDLRDRR